MSQPEPELKHPPELVPRLAAIIHAAAFPTGDRAALRRMGITGPAPLAFHRLMLRHIPERWNGPRDRDRWRALVSALAMQHLNPHDPSRSFGGALAEIGFAESRLESLLAARGRVGATLALRVARRLAVNRARCDWCDLGWLLFSRDDETRERVNERIARAFYRVAVTS